MLVSIGLFSASGACEKPARFQITPSVFDRVTIHLHPKYFSGGKFIIVAAGSQLFHTVRFANQGLPNWEIGRDQIISGGTLTWER